MKEAGNVKIAKCEHEIDEATKKFVEGKGLTGVCKHCGTKLVRSIRHPVIPSNKPHMSKKERLRARKNK